MASIRIIYTYPFNPRVMKAAAALNRYTVDIIPEFIITKINKSPEFLLDFPLDKILTEFANYKLFKPLQNMVLWCYSMAGFDKALELRSYSRLEVFLSILEAHLQGREFMASGDLSMADLSVTAAMVWGYG
ncbi:hypothetical protein ASPNIDRAFT_127419 [Aspergillus niger ATCC 1015]|uniref:Uncharacterized protein n=1 Tax=Aspergillus niger (strain ATCC 1015 / CBS 113.46 / FGSC A1144 / LSHB Ac4 / NCTC 3858a / NRRL 328 / USDA 3528.7) TaxID=380704 RepID=G3XWW0_ASPNA|nr:hypothetical protein ASPNIDRAFT_127419 [Aspergillus niger ATCC 1015]